MRIELSKRFTFFAWVSCALLLVNACGGSTTQKSSAEHLAAKATDKTTSNLKTGWLALAGSADSSRSDSIDFNGETYLIGPSTEPGVLSALQNLHAKYPDGGVSISITFTGNIAQSVGLLAGPSVQVPVIHLLSLVEN